MAWSTLYISILERYTEEWVSAKTKPTVKDTLVKKIAAEIRINRTKNHPEEGVIVNLEKAGLQ
jgi:hypothetical protein